MSGMIRLQAMAAEGVRTARAVALRLLPDPRATTATEYAVLLMLIVLGAIAIVTSIGGVTDRLARSSAAPMGAIASGQHGVVIVDAPGHSTDIPTSGLPSD